MKGRALSFITAAVVALGISGYAQAPSQNPSIRSFAPTDMGNKKKDLVLVTKQSASKLSGNLAPSEVRVAYWTGNGYGEPKLFPQIIQPNAKAVDAGDLNGDRKDDLAFLTASPAELTKIVAYMGNGKGKFSQSIELYRGNLSIEDISIGDLDNDKINDITATVNPGAHMRSDERADVGYKKTYFVYFKGDGKGGFAVPVRVAIDNSDAQHLEVYDADGDGLCDVVTMDFIALRENTERKDYDKGLGVSFIKNKGNLQFDETKTIMTLTEWWTDFQADPSLCPEKPNLAWLWDKQHYVFANDASAEQVVCKLEPKVNGLFQNTIKNYEDSFIITNEEKSKVIQSIYQN